METKEQAVAKDVSFYVHGQHVVGKMYDKEMSYEQKSEQKERLQKMADDMKGKPVDDETPEKNRIGVVEDAWVDENTVHAKMKIDKGGHYECMVYMEIEGSGKEATGPTLSEILERPKFSEEEERKFELVKEILNKENPTEKEAEFQEMFKRMK